MKTYGLLGYPLGHSFSARFFAEKFEREGIDAEYLNFEFPEVGAALSRMLDEYPALRGFNVTIPHKQAVIPHLDALSAEAEAIGAVNVVRVERNAESGVPYLTGYNSDVIGFCNSIAPLIDKKIHSAALVLGTGGASKAVVHGLNKLGLETKYVSRTQRPDGFTYAQLTPDVMEHYRVIVNCSPVGMFPHVDESPDIPYQFLTPQHLLYDLVYNPLVTLFMKKGEAQGAKVKNGLEMLHLQALAAWEMWNE